MRSWFETNCRAGCLREERFALVSSKSDIALCSDTGGHLLWEPWWLKLIHWAPGYCWIMHKAPRGSGGGHSQHSPPQKTLSLPLHLLPTHDIHAMHTEVALIVTVLTRELKRYQGDSSLIPSLNPSRFSKHCTSSVQQCCMPDPFTVPSCFFFPPYLKSFDTKPYWNACTVLDRDDNNSSFTWPR